MKKIEFVIEGDPFGKQRPLVVNRHGIKRKETRQYERKARGSWNPKFLNQKETLGAVSVDIKAFYRIPKSWPKWKKEAAKRQLIRPVKKSRYKPDVDNVAKMIMDSCNPETSRRQVIQQGIYHDDGQVTDLSIKSWYSDHPRVEVCLTIDEEYQADVIKEKVKNVKD